MISPGELKIGFIISTPVSFDSDNHFIQIACMLNDYYQDKYHHDLDRQKGYRSRLLSTSQPWCFMVTEIHPEYAKVSHFTKDLISIKLNIKQSLRWKNYVFNTYDYGFRLKYQDMEIPTLPRCLDCHNYCNQTCIQYLKFYD